MADEEGFRHDRWQIVRIGERLTARVTRPPSGRAIYAVLRRDRSTTNPGRPAGSVADGYNAPCACARALVRCRNDRRSVMQYTPRRLTDYTASRTARCQNLIGVRDDHPTGRSVKTPGHLVFLPPCLPTPAVVRRKSPKSSSA